MKQIRNWRDYLDDDLEWKQKITKKSKHPAKQQNEREEFNKRNGKNRSKQKQDIFIYMAVTTKSKIGKYVCKVGYLDIRQRILFKQPTEVFVVHCRNILAGPFNSISKAKLQAKLLVTDKIKYDKHRK